MLTASLIALSCLTFEAQVISRVKEIRTTPEPGVCEMIIHVDLSERRQMFRSSNMCPLSVDEVLNTPILTDRCELQPGDLVSGYLVSDGETIVLE